MNSVENRGGWWAPCARREPLVSSGAAALVVLLLSLAVARPAELYVHVPGIVGEQSPPGYSGAMSIQSLEITLGQFVIVKNVDAASPQIVTAVINGTLFPSGSALLYNSAPAGPPDAAFVFHNMVASSYQLQGGGTTEQDTFNAANPGSMFLEVPGIVGESSPPGHPGVMQINSFLLTANQFSIIKPVDSASPQLVLAVLNGTFLPVANALFYNAAIPPGAPDGTFGFQNVVATSYQLLNTDERVTFNFVGVPEPTTTTLLVCVALIGVLSRRRTRLR